MAVYIKDNCVGSEPIDFTGYNPNTEDTNRVISSHDVELQQQLSGLEYLCQAHNLVADISAGLAVPAGRHEYDIARSAIQAKLSPFGVDLELNSSASLDNVKDLLLSNMGSMLNNIKASANANLQYHAAAQKPYLKKLRPYQG